MKNKNPLRIIRIGLALVFLANALTAFFSPQEFRILIEQSFLANLLPISTSALVWIIGVNDLLLTLLILFKRFQKYVLIWAMLWLIAVIILTKELSAILEHLGFFSMALTLWVERKRLDTV